MKQKGHILNREEWLFLTGLGIILIFWMFLIPYNGAPDEAMRYQIPQFIYQYGYLPHGDDPRILDQIWGISYAFSPILTYMISALFMGVGSIFSQDGIFLLYCARFPSLLFSIMTGFVCIKIGNEVFKNSYSKWLFVLLVTFLPQFQFISAYVNCDSIAVFCISLIIYFLIIGHKKSWDYKTCIFLGLSIGLCLLSYYNTYGVILITVFYCIFDVISNDKIEHKISFILRRVLIVFLGAFLVSGWWFIRSFIIYDGDILGRNAARICQEANAQYDFKPSVKKSLMQQGYSLSQMLFSMGWISSSYKSFIGAFSYMSIWLPNVIYIFYLIPLTLGFLGNFKAIYKKEQKNFLFSIALALMCVISIGISIYYSYTSDYQAQGRYCFAMLIPINLLIVNGLEYLNINKKVKKYIIITISFMIVLIALYALFGVYGFGRMA